MGEYFFIDLGTNTVRLLITDPEKISSSIDQEVYSYITGFGRGLSSTGKLSEMGCLRTLAALRRFRKILDERKIREGVAFATESLRKAREVDPRGTEFFLRKARAMGFRFKVITGEEESLLSYRGAVRGMEIAGFQVDRPVVFDIGGGSTEFSDGERSVSFKIGSVALRDVFRDPIDAFHYSRDFLRGNIQDFMKGLKTNSKANSKNEITLIGVAGTITTLASVVKRATIYRASLVQGSYLSFSQVESLFEFFREKYLLNSIEDIAYLKGMEPKRASVIPFGAALVLAAMISFGAGGVFASDWSVLQGMAIDYFGASTDGS